MDYRRPLFQLEQWSPFLAKKIWGLTPIFYSPLQLALGLNVKAITDRNVEIKIPLTRFTREEGGAMSSSTLLTVGEFAAKLLWQRHLTPRTEEMTLTSIHCRFIRPSLGAVRARAELHEVERENTLRKLRAGHDADVEMAVIFIDEKDQQIASLNCVWQMMARQPLTLGQRPNPKQRKAK